LSIFKVWDFKIILAQGIQDFAPPGWNPPKVDFSDKWDVETQVNSSVQGQEYFSDNWDVETLVDSTISLKNIDKSEGPTLR
jgi:hypothetical protein